LTWLALGENEISDLSPLAGLVNMNALSMWDNQVSDLSPISAMENLTELYISRNSISDLSPLASMNLTLLSANGNQISDLSPLVTLTDMVWLALAENEIRNIEPLAGLSQLHILDLNANQVTNISPLAGLTSMQALYLENNGISTISVLAGLENLISLNIIGNGIRDLSPLANHQNFYRIHTSDNPITDFSPVAHVQLVYGRPVVPGQVIYRLSEDFHVQLLYTGFQRTGWDFFFIDNHLGVNQFLMQSGTPTFEIVEGPYGNAIRVSDRNAVFYALDLQLSHFEFFDFETNSYEFTIVGRAHVDGLIAFVLGAMDSPWTWLFTTEIGGEEVFSVTHTVSPEVLVANGGLGQVLERGFRLMTQCTSPFTIYEIIVRRV